MPEGNLGVGRAVDQQVSRGGPADGAQRRDAVWIKLSNFSVAAQQLPQFLVSDAREERKMGRPTALAATDGGSARAL